MTGRELTRIIEDRLLELGMSRGQFCRELGISSAAFSAWKNGSMPKPERIDQIEKCLGISFSDYEKCDPREDLRDDLRILLHSASDLQPSSVYALISQIEKMKEDAN